MPSRKRNKGKERKAKKAVLEFERIDNERAEVRNYWLGWARGEDEVRQITQCNHGISLVIPDGNHPVTNFIDALFVNAANNSALCVRQYLRDTFTRHREVWDNERYREMAIDIVVVIETNVLLSNVHAGYFFAVAVVVLENYDGIGIISTLNSRVVAAKHRDLICGEISTNKRDLLKFYRNRTTCSCLKKMHSAARKTVPKLGGCQHCGVVKERLLLMVCSRCRIMQYCSRKCHVADWSRHKGYCEHCVSAYKQQQAKKM